MHELGIVFEVLVKEYDESYPEHLSGEQIASYIASAKARCFRKDIAIDEIVITADTIVWCNNKLLGKPLDEADAFAILSEISGNTHDVITGVTILSAEKEKTFTETTKVTFAPLTGEEISYYISNFKPYDKAGAYGIQEWIGLVACSRIEGSYFNVVGLPVERLYRELKEFILKGS